MTHHHFDTVISAGDRELAEVFASGKQTGFSDSFASLQGAQVINVQVSPWNARDWLVTLGAMKNSNKPDPTALVANVPPDNQVAIAIGGTRFAPEVTNYRIRGIYVRAFWGTGNAMEVAYVSWPFGGCSIPLHGALVRVEVPSGFDLTALDPGQFIPTLQGFVSPNARRDGGMQSPPTLLTSTQPMPSAAAQIAGVDFWAPPRAVGYRLYTTVDADGLAGFTPQVQVQQALWLGGVPTSVAAMDGTNVELYRGNSSTLDQSLAAGNAQYRATGQPNDWRRLLPGSVGIHVSIPNGQNGRDIDVGVEWMLDLG